MTNEELVARLRKAAWPLCHDAADAIEKLQAAFVTASENWSAKIKEIADIHCTTIDEVNQLTFALMDKQADCVKLAEQLGQMSRASGAQFKREVELRNDMDCIWGYLGFNELVQMRDDVPDVLIRLQENHQKVAHVPKRSAS